MAKKQSRQSKNRRGAAQAGASSDLDSLIKSALHARWTVSISDKSALQPASPSHLDEAKLLMSSCARQPLPNDIDQYLTDLAVGYNCQNYILDGCPRLKDVEARLAGVERAFAEAALSLAALDDISLIEMLGIVDPFSPFSPASDHTSDDFRRAFCAAFSVDGACRPDDRTAPDENPPPEPDSPHGSRFDCVRPTLDRVMALSRLAGYALARLRAAHGGDRGGRESLYARMAGNPKRNLVEGCRDLALDCCEDDFFRGDANSSRFGEFVRSVVSFAVGTDADEQHWAGFDDHIKNVMAQTRHRAAFDKQLANLDIFGLRKGKPNPGNT